MNLLTAAFCLSKGIGKKRKKNADNHNITLASHLNNDI